MILPRILCKKWTKQYINTAPFEWKFTMIIQEYSNEFLYDKIGKK